MKLFLSHCSSDKAIVREIKGKLYGFLDTWLDERQLIPGEQFVDSLKEAISKTDLLLLFISKSALESRWVDQEIKWAISIENEIKRPFIIPIILDNSNLPESLNSKLYLKLSSQKSVDVNSLADELNRKLFQYVIKYGFHGKKELESESTNNEQPNKFDGFHAGVAFANQLTMSAKLDIINKYLELIVNNIELKPKIILLLCNDELNAEILEMEERERKWQETTNKNDDKTESENEGLAGPVLALKGLSNDAKMDILTDIQRKIKFILANDNEISAIEGVYMLKKHLSFFQTKLSKKQEFLKPSRKNGEVKS